MIRSSLIISLVLIVHDHKEYESSLSNRASNIHSCDHVVYVLHLWKYLEVTEPLLDETSGTPVSLLYSRVYPVQDDPRRRDSIVVNVINQYPWRRWWCWMSAKLRRSKFAHLILRTT